MVLPSTALVTGLTQEALTQETILWFSDVFGTWISCCTDMIQCQSVCICVRARFVCVCVSQCVAKTTQGNQSPLRTDPMIAVLWVQVRSIPLTSPSA